MFKFNNDIPKIELARFSKENGYLDSKFLRELKKLPKKGEYIISSQDYRVDLYANEIWGEPNWGWMLAIYNGKTIYEMKFGTRISYPTKESIKTLISSL